MRISPRNSRGSFLPAESKSMKDAGRDFPGFLCRAKLAGKETSMEESWAYPVAAH